MSKMKLQGSKGNKLGDPPMTPKHGKMVEMKAAFKNAPNKIATQNSKKTLS